MPMKCAPLIPISDLVEGSGNLSTEIAKGARDFVCELYRKYPDWAVNGGVVTPIKSLYDSICGTPDNPLPLPSPPVVPYTGGQCKVLYRLNFRFRLYQANGTYGGELTDFRENIMGPIGQIYTIFGDFATGSCDTFPPGHRLRYAALVVPTGNGLVTLSAATSCLPVDGSMNRYLPTFQSVSRMDGRADNCGDPPVSFPSKNRPPGDELTRDHPTTGNDGTKLIVPLVYVRPTFELNPNIQVDFNVNPEFNGNVNFDFSGATVEFGSGEGNGSNVDLNQIYQRLDGLQTDADLIKGGVTKVDNTTTQVLGDVTQIKTNVEELKAEFDREYQLEYTDYDFENESRTTEVITYQGFGGIAVATSRISLDTTDIQERVTDLDIELPMPQRFMHSHGSQIPQLLLVYRDINDSNSFGRKRCQITIPYPIDPESLKDRDKYDEGIRYYLHGSWEGICLLPETEIKLTVNCADSDEVKRMLRKAADFCEPLKSVTQLNGRVAERFDKEFVTEYVAALRWVSYYSKGIKDAKPDWVLRFNKP